LTAPGSSTGEIDAVFRSLFDEHGHRVFSVALRLTDGRPEAEELTVDTFLQAYRSLSAFDDERLDTLRIRPWLSAILVQLWRSQVRSASRRSAPTRPPEAIGPGPVDPATPLLNLSDRQRMAVVLHHTGGLPVAEVAEALGCSPGTAASLVSADRTAIVGPLLADDADGGRHGAGISQRAHRSGPAPVDLMDRIVARWAFVNGPVEDAYVASTSEGIANVVPASRVAGPEQFATEFSRTFGRPLLAAVLPPDGVAEALRTGRATGLRLDLRGRTDFERAVLAVTGRIPPGEVRPYAWVATEIRRPRAVRAVGTALGHNPVPLLIPCHRVIRSDGSMGQYGGFGTVMKRRLLEGEGIDVDQFEILARGGSLGGR
jgi:O-6-methylguanine DNA methyltransferase